MDTIKCNSLYSNCFELLEQDDVKEEFFGNKFQFQTLILFTVKKNFIILLLALITVRFEEQFNDGNPN